MSSNQDYGDRPATDYVDVSSDEDVYDLVDEGVIGQPDEYGFSCLEEMVDFILGRNFSEMSEEAVSEFHGLFDEHQDRALVVEEEERDEWIGRNLSYAGGVWYNPENGDEWITNDPDLVD